MDIAPQKLLTLRRYAATEARAKGIPLPGCDDMPPESEAVALARIMAHSGQFLPQDLNGDNRKRNIAIRLFLDTPLNSLRQYGRNWLERWREKNGAAPWFREWDTLIETAPDETLVWILLSPEQEPTRLRLSMPFPGLLEADVVLQIKRTGNPA